MAKASKAFNRINDGTPGFKPQFKKDSNFRSNSGYKPNNKPNNGVFKPKPKFEKKVVPVTVDKRLHTLFMSTKEHTLLFKVFIATEGSKLPVFNKVLVRNVKKDGENIFSYYLYDANYQGRVENWDANLEITDVIFYADTNVKFTLKNGVSVTCEQIISKKFIDAKFQEFVLGKKPTAKG